MIEKSMFFSENPTIGDYRDMKLDDILREFLLNSGTRSKSKRNGRIVIEEKNHYVSVKQIIISGLFVYSLKTNNTNKNAVAYYCEREARKRGLLRQGDIIRVPDQLWTECDEHNKEFTNGSDRDPIAFY